MSDKGDDFWLDDPEWAVLREKQKHKNAKLSRAQRKALKEAQFQAELRAQQAKAQAEAVNPSAHPVQPVLQPNPQRSAPQQTPQVQVVPTSHINPANSGSTESQSRARAYIGGNRPSSRYTRPQTSLPTQTTAPASNEGAKKVNLSLNLTIPHINLGSFRKLGTSSSVALKKITPRPVRRQFAKRSRKQRLLAGSVVAIVVVALIGFMLFAPSSKNGKSNGQTEVLADKTSAVKIDFKPLLPNGSADQAPTSKTALDGQGRPIFTFTDKIGATDLTITEQPLPESLKPDTDTKLEKMAKDLYLTEVISTANPKAYMGTSIKGPQTVIFAKDGLLVFIQSQAKIDKDQWADYVTRLLQ